MDKIKEQTNYQKWVNGATIQNRVTPEMILKFFKKYPETQSALDYQEQVKNDICIPLDEGEGAIPWGMDGGKAILEGYLTPEDTEKFINEFCDIIEPY